MSDRFLISGFTSFGPHESNPTEFFLNSVALPDLCQKIILPVTFEQSFSQLQLKIEESRPSKIIMLGLAADRTKIALEKIAINFIDCSIQDNNGVMLKNKKISNDGEGLYCSRLDLDGIVSKYKGHDVSISHHAGVYVCNFLYYQVLKIYPDIPSVFVHVPINFKNELLYKLIVDIITD